MTLALRELGYVKLHDLTSRGNQSFQRGKILDQFQSLIESALAPTPSALRITASADGSWTVRSAQLRAGRGTHTSPSETGVVVLVSVLVGGPCMQFRHATSPFLVFTPGGVHRWI